MKSKKQIEADMKKVINQRKNRRFSDEQLNQRKNDYFLGWLQALEWVLKDEQNS